MTQSAVINTTVEVFPITVLHGCSCSWSFWPGYKTFCINRIFFSSVALFYVILTQSFLWMPLPFAHVSSCLLSSTPFTGSCCLLLWYQRSCSCLLPLIPLLTLFVFSTCPLSSHTSSWPIVRSALHDYNSTRLCPVVIHLLPKVMVTVLRECRPWKEI